MKSIWLFAVFFLGLPWSLDAHATSCPADRAAAVKEALGNLRNELEPKTSENWDSLRKTEELLSDLNDLEKKTDIVVVMTATRSGQDLAEQQMKTIRSKIGVLQKSIEQGLPQADGYDLVNSIRNSFNDGVSAVDRAQPVGLKKTPFDQAKLQVIRMRAYRELAEDSLRVVEVTERALEDQCRENISFSAKLENQSYQFAGCSQLANLGDVEAATWGGKLPADGCRYVVTCSDLKGPTDASMGGGFWILDCKKRSNTCPDASGCATQIQADSGSVQMGPVINKRKGSAR